jgi:hypothetical protein
MSHYAKYLKYKNKYLSLKKDGQKGGFTCKHENGYKNILGTCWMVAIQMIFSFGGVSGRLLEKNIQKMNIKNMIHRATRIPYIEKILPGVLETSKSVYLESILTTFIKRYRSKLELPDISKTVKPLDLSDKENKERCELGISQNFKELFKDFIGDSNSEGIYSGNIAIVYLFSNLLSVFLLGRKTSLINYHYNHPDTGKKFSNINYINHENYGILIYIAGHVCCFFICGGVEKYYNDDDGKIYPCDWKELLKKTTDTRCLYVQEKGCILLLYYEEYINHKNKSKLSKIHSLSVLSIDQCINSFDLDFDNYMNKSYYLLTPKSDNQLLYLTGGYFDSIGDNKNSLKYHKMAAENGVTDSQIFLGKTFADVYNDFEQAIFYYKMASDYGDMISQFRLGMIYEYLKNLDQARIYYRKSAENGNIDANKRLQLLL